MCGKDTSSGHDFCTKEEKLSNVPFNVFFTLWIPTRWRSLFSGILVLVKLFNGKEDKDLLCLTTAADRWLIALNELENGTLVSTFVRFQ